ncbi:hypothetical protein NRS6120_05780 [Bacillus subtilis]|nr:hypothetical protein NRS6120_01958 [Bacillus subtilis]CAI6245621.1 hypothetical protein NRS6120_05780 [Bacillus subtilis]
MKIALLGASGRVGQAFLTQAAADERFDIFALIRSQHADLPLSKDRTVMGNARRLEDVKKIMENAEIVISCLGTDVMIPCQLLWHTFSLLWRNSISNGLLRSAPQGS